VIESEDRRKGLRKSENRGLGWFVIAGYDIGMDTVELTGRLVSHYYSYSLRLLYYCVERFLSVGEKGS